MSREAKRECYGLHIWGGWDLWKYMGRSFLVRTCQWCGKEERHE